MSNIITNIRVIEPSHWNKEIDGLWYVHIPFEAKGKDTLLEFVDPDEYIQEHKEDFDALNSGFTTDTECTITADHCPSCAMAVQIKFCDEEDGEIIYKQNAEGKFIPEWRQNNVGGFRGFAEEMNTSEIDGIKFSNQIVDTEGKAI